MSATFSCSRRPDSYEAVRTSAAGGAGRGVRILELLLPETRGLNRDLPFGASAPCAEELGRLLHGSGSSRSVAVTISRS